MNRSRSYKFKVNLNSTVDPTDLPLPRTRNSCLVSKLPEELLGEVAELLAATHSLASLAAFNVTCRSIHHHTLPVLFRSLILVTRDPEGYVELEKAVTVSKKKDPVPKGFQYVQFLFVGKAALDTLTAYGNKKRVKPFDKGPLETIFPRLAVVFFRISDLQRREADPNKPVQYKVSRMPYPQTTNITQIAADIYRPIKPFRLMSACVIGSHLRETCIADTVICEAANFDENDSCELPDWTPLKRPRKVKVIDNLYKVSFKANGRFLPQAEGDAFDFPGRIGDHPEIEVDPKALDDDTADGSRSRDIAKGIFALLPPRTMKLGQFDKLPQIRVVQGNGVTYMPLLSELVRHFPLKACINISDSKLLSLSQTVKDFEWVAAQLQARYADLKIPRRQNGDKNILEINASGASDSPGPCVWFGYLTGRSPKKKVTMYDGTSVPNAKGGIVFQQMHQTRESAGIRFTKNSWLYPAGQGESVVVHLGQEIDTMSF